MKHPDIERTFLKTNNIPLLSKYLKILKNLKMNQFQQLILC